MENLVKAARIGYGIATWPAHHIVFNIMAGIGSMALIGTGIAIIFEVQTRTVALVLGGSFLVLLFMSYVPYEIIIDPYSKHIAMWTNPFKELSMAGGALYIASLYPKYKNLQQPVLLTWLEKLIPFAGWMFAATMICFGIEHFLYRDNVVNLVPAYMPDRAFWVIFAGAALIGSGVSIVLHIRVKTIVNLLGIMIFIWIIMLHIPRAIADPLTERGNEITSVFSALSSSSIAFIIANSNPRGFYTEKL
jgi:uncharacterized membrane protein YphA (DoxX/SURF4 family)